jgi:hypothetical protein
VSQSCLDLTVSVFYRTERAGVIRLADGGGPFGFDVCAAILADDLISRYGCAMIAETGCFLGDTTAYLAHRYPDLPVRSCDTDPACAAFTARRLRDCPNAMITCEDSPLMLAGLTGRGGPVFAFLDAHWGPQWPLIRELDALTGMPAVVMIHDFDIGHPRFSFDAYDGLVCGPGIFSRMQRPPGRYFVLDPAARWPVPCQQAGRRAGVAVITTVGGDSMLAACPYLAVRTALARQPGAAGARP